VKQARITDEDLRRFDQPFFDIGFIGRQHPQDKGLFHQVNIGSNGVVTHAKGGAELGAVDFIKADQLIGINSKKSLGVPQLVGVRRALQIVDP
jgi:hypothetical protein